MPTIEERRERKRIAAERLVTADIAYIDAVFEGQYLPFLVGIHDGTCISISTGSRQIIVTLDSFENDTRQLIVPVAWDRPRLSASEVVNKRVKVYLPRNGSPFVLAAITS